MKSTTIDDLEYVVKKTNKAISILKNITSDRTEVDLLEAKNCLAIAGYILDNANREVGVRLKDLGFFHD